MGSEIKYLLVKDFEWKDLMMREQYQGHPKPGQVYRAIYNEDSKNYKLVVGKTLMLVDILKSDGTSEDVGAMRDIIVLDRHNLITSNVSEEELDKIIDWDKSGNKDLGSVINPVVSSAASIKEGLGRLMGAMDEQQYKEAVAMADAREILGVMWSTNTELFHLIVEVAAALCENDLKISPFGMAMELGPDGKGINVYRAISRLNKYVDKVKNGGDNREDVVDAIVSLFTELSRRKYLNIDDE